MLAQTAPVGLFRAGVDTTLTRVYNKFLTLIKVKPAQNLRIDREVPSAAPLIVAGDFNDWGKTVQREMAAFGMAAFDGQPQPTFPSRLPLAQLDQIFVRGMQPLGLQVPRGRIWWRMSDHLPLVAEFALPD